MRLSKLRELRKTKGYTQEEVAKYLGYKSKNAYHLIETGKRKLTLDNAKKIADLLEEPIDKIFFENDVAKTITQEDESA